MCYPGKENLGNSGVGRVASPDNREIVISANATKATNEVQNALALEDQGNLIDAEQAYLKVIVNRNENQNRDGQIVLFCQDKLASLWRSRGLYKNAEKRCSTVLGEMKRMISLGKGHSLTLHCAGSLALILRDQGRYRDAILLFHDIWGTPVGDLYQDITRVRLVSILATILQDIGSINLSLYLTRNVLSACDMLLGPDDPFTLDQASNLAILLSQRGDHRLAEVIDRRGLETLKKTLGPYHPQSLRTTTQLGKHMLYQERYEDAMTLFQRTLSVQETNLGSSHPDTWSTKRGLAISYALQDRLSDAMILLRHVKHQQIEMLTEDHPDRIWTEEILSHLEKAEKASGQKDTAQKLQYGHDAGYDVNVQLESLIRKMLGPPLQAACFAGDEMRINEMLQSKVDTNVQGGLFGTPVCAASFIGQKAIVRKLLDAGADPNAKGNLAGSPLRAALMMNHQEICPILLEKGANPNRIDRWYGTPLHEASMAGHAAMVNLLLEAGAKPNLRGGVFGTALVASAWQGNVKSVKCLLYKGAFLDGHENGKTALYMATVEKHDEVVEALTEEAKQKRAKFVVPHSPKAGTENFETPAKNLQKKEPASRKFPRRTAHGLRIAIDSSTMTNSTKVVRKSKSIKQKVVETFETARKRTSRKIKRKQAKQPIST